jgi:hypothetical protein
VSPDGVLGRVSSVAARVGARWGQPRHKELAGLAIAGLCGMLLLIACSPSPMARDGAAAPAAASDKAPSQEHRVDLEIVSSSNGAGRIQT